MRKVTKIALITLLALIVMANIISIITSIGCGGGQDGADPEVKCNDIVPLIEAACPALDFLEGQTKSEIASLVVEACPAAVPIIKRYCPDLVDQIDQQLSEQ